jgi:hypothetical protein
MSMLSVFAVRRLIISQLLLGSSIGRSLGRVSHRGPMSLPIRLLLPVFRLLLRANSPNLDRLMLIVLRLARPREQTGAAALFAAAPIYRRLRLTARRL